MATETLNPATAIADTSAAGETPERFQTELELAEERDELWQQEHQPPGGLQELLLRACQDGQVPAVQQLLQYDLLAMYKADAVRLAEQLFVVCAENGSLECLRLLIRKFRHQLNINAVDEDGTPCLQLAVLGQYVEMVEYLLRCGADVNARDGEQHTALHWAVVCQHHDIMTLLLVNGANVDSPDSRGATPLHYAAHACGKCEQSAEQETALLLLQHLLYVKASANCEDCDGRSPLLWAASAGSSAACKMLIAGGVTVDKVDKNGLSAVHCAAARGHAVAVETLVHSNKVLLDLCDRHGCPPLFYAINHCQLECVRVLLLLGASVSCVDARGRSAAHYSAECGSLEIVKELQAASCGYWSPSNGGELPIHTAIRRGKREIAMFLLEQADKISKATLTECLHLAAGVSDTESISMLLLHFGVNINAVAKYKKIYMTALDIAYRKGFKECYQYIRLKGGRHAAGLVHASARRIQKAFRGAKQAAAGGKHGAQVGDPGEVGDPVDDPAEVGDPVGDPVVGPVGDPVVDPAEDQGEVIQEPNARSGEAMPADSAADSNGSSEASGYVDGSRPLATVDADDIATATRSLINLDATVDPQPAATEALEGDAAGGIAEPPLEVDCNGVAEADAAAQQAAAGESSEQPVEGGCIGAADADVAVEASKATGEPAESVADLCVAHDTDAAVTPKQTESLVEASTKRAEGDEASQEVVANEMPAVRRLDEESNPERVADLTELNVADFSEPEGRLQAELKDNAAEIIDASADGESVESDAEATHDARSSQDNTAGDGVCRAIDTCDDESPSRFENSLEDADRQGQSERDLAECSSDDDVDDDHRELPSPSSQGSLPRQELDGKEGSVSQMTVLDSESHSVHSADNVLTKTSSPYGLNFVAPHPPDLPKPGWAGRKADRSGGGGLSQNERLPDGEETSSISPRRSYTIAFATVGDAEGSRRLLQRPHQTTVLRSRSANRRPETAGGASRLAAMSMSDRIRYTVQQSVREYEEKRRTGNMLMELHRLKRRAPAFSVITLLPSVPAAVHYDSNMEFPAIVTHRNKIRSVRVPWQH